MSTPAELSASTHEVITQPEPEREHDVRMVFTTAEGLTIRIQLRNRQLGDPTVFTRERGGRLQQFTIYPTQSVEIEGAEVGFDAVAHSEDIGQLIVLDQVATFARYRAAGIRPYSITEVSIVDQLL